MEGRTESREAFGPLKGAVERLGGEVFSLALYSLGSREEALSVSQDAFLAAFLLGELERDEEGLRASLLRRAAEFARRSKGAREPDLVELRRRGREVTPELEAVLRALLDLSIRDRLLLLFCEWLGLSVEEAAEISLGGGRKQKEARGMLRKAAERFSRRFEVRLKEAAAAVGRRGGRR